LFRDRALTETKDTLIEQVENRSEHATFVESTYMLYSIGSIPS